MPHRRGIGLTVVLFVALLSASCAPSATPPASGSSVVSSVASASASAAPSAGTGSVVPAPGSDSTVYPPNPAAVVVAIDPGHGGCLDWGVPNPWDNTVDKAEKEATLGIGLALRDLLEAEGISVVMTRTDDSALAGDDYPQLNCEGPPWRDVDGNGEAGFEETGRTRTRDELQARLDLANLARADLLISIHINSMTQDGVVYEIAATQTFYDDETPWGEEGSGSLGRALQGAVVGALDALAPYERQDRGTEAVAYYIVSRQWQDGDTCETPGDTWCKPHRAAQLPTVLSEVGSMSLEAESELLAGDEGRRAVAAGLLDGLRAFFGERQMAVRYDALVPGGEAGTLPGTVEGVGPPFWAPPLPDEVAEQGILPVRLTNTGTDTWPAGLELRLGWSASDQPYLSDAPASLTAVDVAIPALGPGESVVLAVPVDPPAGGRNLAWITLSDGSVPFTDFGSPALQLAWKAE